MKTDPKFTDEREDAWIERYRAMAELHSSPPTQSAFKTFCGTWDRRRVSALRWFDKLLDQLVQGYRPRKNETEASEKSAPPPRPAESPILVQGMKRVELLRSHSGKRAKAVAGRSTPGISKHRKHSA